MIDLEKKVGDLTIFELGITFASSKLLGEVGVTTLRGLVAMSDEEVEKIRTRRIKCYNEIREKFEFYRSDG